MEKKILEYINLFNFLKEKFGEDKYYFALMQKISPPPVDDGYSIDIYLRTEPHILNKETHLFTVKVIDDGFSLIRYLENDIDVFKNILYSSL